MGLNQANYKKQDKKKINKETAENNNKNTNIQSDHKADKKTKIKRNLVILVIAVTALIIYVIQRGEYLEVKEIGENYVPIFWKNFKAITITAIVNFGIIYTSIYITTKKIKNNLNTFFIDEKKNMPRLPLKSSAFIIAILSAIFTSNIIMEKALYCFYGTQFVIVDPVFGQDIGFYVFVLPFIKFVITYIFALSIGLTIYSTLYYLLVFNICFDGISRESVQKSTILDQALFGLKAIIISFAALIVAETQNIGTQKFMTLNSDEALNYSLFGAGSTEIYVRYVSYILLAIIIVFSVFRAIKKFKNKETKQVIRSIMVVPAYLVIVASVMLGYSLIFVNSNELDKERKYINDNIKFTKMGYNVDIEDIKLSDAETIGELELNDNADTIDNIPISNEELVLKDLNTSLTNNDYYKYTYTNKALYSIDDKNQLVYLTPREIETDNSEYSNKTYEYTHGYGVIITSANDMTATGNFNHIQKSFEETNEAVNITEPRIYFGRKTNSIVVTNSTSRNEFDYPLNTSENAENDYHGGAGMQLNLFDRIILAIKEKDTKLAFSGAVKHDSKILTNRNIINRAKTIMPYLMYDNNPYIVIRNNGELVWVIDAYTTSNEFPYSQRTILEDYGITKNEINYIRNSVKVIINAYSGEVRFFLTDKSDPIAAAYKRIYPELFTDESIPEDILNHLVYPSYLYEIQSSIIARYHDIEADDLYRSDDVWQVATHNTTQISNKIGSAITPYYTMLKTTDSNGSRLGLVLPYTPYSKTNINAYLIGSVDAYGNNILKTYTYSKSSSVLGPMQLDTQVSQDETISKQLEELNIAGTKIIKDIFIVPVNNNILYVEPIYQQYVNEPDSTPVLKKVIIASGSKVTVGNTYIEALKNLVSQNAVEIEVENTDDINDLINAIIKANNNLKTSTQSGDWAQMGKDTQRLQELITRMEETKIKEDEKKKEQETNTETNTETESAELLEDN